MSDLISTVVGSGSSTSQDVQVDPTTQALNNLRKDQAQQLFSGTPLSSFVGPSSAYEPSSAVSDLYNRTLWDIDRTTDSNNLINMHDYINNFLNGTNEVYNSGIDQSNNNRLKSRDSNQADFEQMYNLGMNPVANYIHEIATPEIMQSGVLQGQERSGAMPAAIAKATAQAGLPLVQGLMGQYLSNQAGVNQADMAQQANLTNNLFGTRAGFWAGLPGAAQTLEQSSLIPVQRATALFPLADYSRQLKEQDLLRRQGLVQTAFTGLPYTPSTTTEQSQRQKSLFENLGATGPSLFTFGAM